MLQQRTRDLPLGLQGMLRMASGAYGSRAGARARGRGAVACVVAAGLAFSSSSVLADDVLNLYDAQLVTYQASPTLIQDLAPIGGGGRA